MSEKFQVPTELIDLPSKGLLYPKDNPLSSGQVEMKYMTAKEEDILTNSNLLRQGLAIEKMLKSLIKSPINYDDLTIGDRNGLLIASRILAYGKDYTFKYTNDNTGIDEVVTVDLQDLKYKEIDFSLLENVNDFAFTLPYSKTEVTFKILTVEDDRKMEEEIKGLKKTTGLDAGTLSTRLKYQLTSVGGDRSIKTVREFIDGGYLLSRDSNELRKYISSLTPDIDTTVSFRLKDGEEITTDMPLGVDFFFPRS
jgi:hypothetical protein